MKYIILIVALFFTACNVQNSGIDDNQSISDFNKSAISVYFSQQKGAYKNGIDDKIIADINSSKSSIKLALYELTNKKIKDALITAFNRGVDVKVVTDDEYAKNYNLFDELENAGITIKTDASFSSGLMHDKFLIIDNKILWSGSGNYTYYAFYRNYENFFRILDKNVLSSYIDEFNELSNGKLEKDSNNFKYYNVYFSYEDNFRKRELLKLIRDANSSIYIAAFAMTDDELKDELIEDRDRGIIVHILLDKNQNNYQGSYSVYDDLKSSGIDVKLVGGTGHRMHNKFIVVDKKIVETGSYNYTLSANSRNCENILIIKDRDIALKYFNEFEKIYNQ